MNLRLAVFEPDIAQNLGTMIRLAACMDVPIDVIEPCGFPFSVKALRRSAMDYADLAKIEHHDDWAAFDGARSGRLVLLTTKGATSLWDTRFQFGDVVLMGRESAGVPEFVHQRADLRVAIPMPGGGRSLNVAVAAGMVLGEACRQLHASPASGRNADEAT
jgi:tRNA (cytidine/uridine-2'-O-)-methyltransferase